MTPVERVRALIARLDQARDEALVLLAEVTPAEPPAPVPAPPPAPAPEPPPPAPEPPPLAVTLQPPLAGAPQPAHPYLMDDGGSGPSYRASSVHLSLLWRRPDLGDWIDRDGTPQGSVPYSSTPAPALGLLRLEATTLVRDLLTHGNTGARLVTAGGVNLAGREAQRPPMLQVLTPEGMVDCPCLSAPAWTALRTGSGPSDSRQIVRSGDLLFNAALQFDLGRLTAADVLGATIVVDVLARASGARVDLYRLDAPRVQVGCGAAAPRLGLAAEVGEVGMRTHPDVIVAGDFSGGTFDRTTGRGRIGDLFPLFESAAACEPEFLPDPDAPGTTMMRGRFVPVTTGSDPNRGAFSAIRRLTLPDFSDPLFRAKDSPTEAFARCYVFMEDDFGTAVDGNKWGLAWDLRGGYWAGDARGGYWQHISGNGGTRGDGLAKLWTPPTSWGQRIAYAGHFVRMEAGTVARPGAVNGDLRPLQGYVYHLDQTDAFGDMIGYSNRVPAAMARGRWHCIEQQLRLNSIDLSAPDALGNGIARPDGVIRTWLDGVLVDERTDLRWRRHPDAGIFGVGVQKYMGGRITTTTTMHYRVNHFAVARRYIGPRIAP